MNEEADRPLSPLVRWFLLLLVTLTGANVLVLEVLGTRVIGTYYGSSIYVWAALLSVTLVCLAIGYALGGRLADAVPRSWMLFVLVAAAGASVLLVPRLSGVLAPLGDALGLASGAIASAAVIFVLPLTLLATASPYVIRLRARALAGVGSTSGAVYAVSTIGSVGGVLVVSVWMIPRLGTQTSLLVCSGVLMGLGAIGLAILTSGRAAPLILLAALPWWARADWQPLPGEIDHAESAYGELRVLKRIDPNRGEHLILMVNGIMQTGMPMDVNLVKAGSILQSDHYYLELLPYFHSNLGEGRRGVLIGLAGGMFPRVMEKYKIDWTAVEIDREVARIARIHFGYRGEITDANGRPLYSELKPAADRAEAPVIESDTEEDEVPYSHRPSGPYRGRAVIQDGRQYLVSHDAPADFIVVDAYNSDTIPFHLITREFFQLVRSRLTEDGILAINYIGRPSGDFVTDSLFRTLGDVFGPENLTAYRSRDNDREVQVIIIFAFMKQMRLLPLWRDEVYDTSADTLSYELVKRKLETQREGGVIITDDRNPIDLARAETALEWRRETMKALE